MNELNPGDDQMKFLALCHYSAADFARLGPEDFGQIAAICAPHDKALRDSGHLFAVGSLGFPEQSKTLRVEKEGIVATDGPYAKTPEPFGAFFILDAESFEQAIEIAKLHPGVHLGDKFGPGGIEVRQIESFDQV
jgi:hypothetical protein